MQFQHTTLDNGLEVIAELNDGAYSVAAGFFVKAGSRDESSELAGVSHFLEHMTFKGTTRRDAVAVNRDFDRVGAKHNAQTSEEDTFYHVTCLPEYLPQAFDVLADILRPTFRGDDFETEKQGDHRGNPDVSGQPDVRGLRGGQDRPLRLTPARQQHSGDGRLDQGTGGRPDARLFHAKRYSPANIVLAFAGKADWNSLVELAQNHCGAWQGGPASRQAAPFRGSGSFRAILRADDQQQTVVASATDHPWKATTDTRRTCWRRFSATIPARGSTGR